LEVNNVNYGEEKRSDELEVFEYEDRENFNGSVRGNGMLYPMEIVWRNLTITMLLVYWAL